MVNYLSKTDIKGTGIVLGLIEEGLKQTIKFRVKVTSFDQPKSLGHAVLISKDYMKDELFGMYLEIIC
jgi:dTDP-glucose pyrophosphorylase